MVIQLDHGLSHNCIRAYVILSHGRRSVDRLYIPIRHNLSLLMSTLVDVEGAELEGLEGQSINKRCPLKCHITLRAELASLGVNFAISARFLAVILVAAKAGVKIISKKTVGVLWICKTLAAITVLIAYIILGP